MSIWACERPRPFRLTSASTSLPSRKPTPTSRGRRASDALSRCPRADSYAPLDPGAAARQADHGRDEKQDDGDKEDRLGGFNGNARDAAETQNTGDQRDDQKRNDPAQHDTLRFLLTVSAIRRRV